MNCENHPNHEAVCSCAVCGKNICRYCRTVNAGKSYCPGCIEGEFGIPFSDSVEALESATEAAAVPAARSRIPSILLMPLFAATYVIIFTSMELSTSVLTTLIVTAAMSFLFQIVWIMRTSEWAWWGSTVTWIINSLIVNYAGFLNLSHDVHHSSPLGTLISIPLLLFFVPVSLGLLFWDKFRRQYMAVRIGLMALFVTFTMFIAGAIFSA